MTINKPGYPGKQFVKSVAEIDSNVYILSFERNFDFLPGQIVALSIDKSDPAPRLYSICSGTEDKEIKILFNIVPGGKLTTRMAGMKKGDIIYSSNPYGRFLIKEEPAVWIANGTGVAPFVSRVLSGSRKPVMLLHGGRSEASFYFDDIFKQSKNIDYIKCSSTINNSAYFQGRITKYLSESDTLPQERRYYLCGSTEMVVEARDILISKGIKYNMIESEIYF